MFDTSSIPPAQREQLYNTPGFQPPDGTTPNFDDPPNGDGAVAVVIICIIMATCSAILRVISKVFYSKKFEIQDLLGFLSFGCYAGSMWAVLDVYRTIGYFVRQWNVRALYLVHFSYCAFILQVLYSFAMLFGKCAILIDWMRIFSPRGLRNSFFWCSIALIVLNSLVYSATIIALNLGCIPLQKLWHFWLPGSCIHRSALDMTTSCMNCFIDLCLFFLPQKSIWSLKMPAKRKIGIAITFSIGAIACLGAIGRVISTANTDYVGERTFVASGIIISGTVELSFMIIIFCVPTIPRIFVDSNLISKMRSYIRTWTPLSRRSHDNESEVYLAAMKSETAGKHQAAQGNIVRLEDVGHSVTRSRLHESQSVGDRYRETGDGILRTTEFSADIDPPEGPHSNSRYRVSGW